VIRFCFRFPSYPPIAVAVAPHPFHPVFRFEREAALLLPQAIPWLLLSDIQPVLFHVPSYSDAFPLHGSDKRRLTKRPVFNLVLLDNNRNNHNIFGESGFPGAITDIMLGSLIF
jgi:hypothetical protein